MAFLKGLKREHSHRHTYTYTPYHRTHLRMHCVPGSGHHSNVTLQPDSLMRTSPHRKKTCSLTLFVFISVSITVCMCLVRSKKDGAKLTKHNTLLCFDLNVLLCPHVIRPNSLKPLGEVGKECNEEAIRYHWLWLRHQLQLYKGQNMLCGGELKGVEVTSVLVASVQMDVCVHVAIKSTVCQSKNHLAKLS